MVLAPIIGSIFGVAELVDETFITEGILPLFFVFPAGNLSGSFRDRNTLDNTHRRAGGDHLRESEMRSCKKIGKFLYRAFTSCMNNQHKHVRHLAQRSLRWLS